MGQASLSVGTRKAALEIIPTRMGTCARPTPPQESQTERTCSGRQDVSGRRRHEPEEPAFAVEPFELMRAGVFESQPGTL